MDKIAQKMPKTLNKTLEKNNKNQHSCEKLAHPAGSLGPPFSISEPTETCLFHAFSLKRPWARSEGENLQEQGNLHKPWHFWSVIMLTWRQNMPSKSWKNTRLTLMTLMRVTGLVLFYSNTIDDKKVACPILMGSLRFTPCHLSVVLKLT